jgi:dynein heavy chain
LFNTDELAEIKSDLAKLGDTEDDIMRAFYDRIRKNLHVILCLSPLSEKFKKWIRMFPAIINNTVIDCFTDWPEDALEEVAKKFLADLEVEDPSLKAAISRMSVVAHLSVKDEARKMLLEMKRLSYVTPVNFLELLSEYKRLLKEKRIEIGNAASKLRNGLQKLDDTKVSVEKISKELELAKIQVAKFQKECDDYLVVIVQQKREADDQAKSVASRADKLGVEEAEVRVVADAAQADLDLALPALNAAVKALEAINKKDLNEIRSYGKPPTLVEKVMEAVMVLKKSEPTWEEAKKQLGNPNFIKTLVGFDKDNISDKILKRISQYCGDENFQVSSPLI